MQRFTGAYPRPKPEEERDRAARLLWARARRGIGSAALCEMADVGSGEVSRIEKRKRRNLASDTVGNLAKALEVFHCWLDEGKRDRGRIFLEQPADDADIREELATLKLQVGAIMKVAEIADPTVTRLKPRPPKPVPPKR